MIYLDNAATTKIAPEVTMAMQQCQERYFGNASSLHIAGKEAAAQLEKARETIARKLNARAGEIIFTSGGTESNILALRGIAYANQQKGKHIITSQIEHASVLETCKQLEKEGFTVTYLPVDVEGHVSAEKLEKAIRPDTILVSIMHANNEIGTIQDIETLAKICAHKNIVFHSDIVQSFCKIPLDVQRIPVTALSLSAHKIHGPKGMGALFLRQGTRIEPQQRGGEHEFRLRAGTVNVPGAVGFAKAVELLNAEDCLRMGELRDWFISRVCEEIPETKLNGPKERLCNNISLAFKYVEADSLLALLDEKGICVSTGSACESYSLEPSHVLQALRLPTEYAQGTLRFSLSKYTTREELEQTISVLKSAVQKLRKQSKLV